MSKKSAKIAELIEKCHGQGRDAHYLGFFECFNRGWFYEAHDVLEELWLPQRKGPNGAFYKGLIQLAGAFVHLQKERLRPAAALFKLAGANLGQYSEVYEGLEISRAMELIDVWVRKLEMGEFRVNPLQPGNAPELRLIDSRGTEAT